MDGPRQHPARRDPDLHFLGPASRHLFLRPALGAVPEPLVEAMRVDGASTARIATRLFLPMSASTLVAVAVLTVLRAWNDSIIMIVMRNNPSLYTLPVLVAARLAHLGPARSERRSDACAKVADLVRRSCCAIRVLATSREPLGTDGGHVYRLRPLSLPAEGSDSVEALAGPEAVQLFVECARDGSFVLDDPDAALVASICRCLDLPVP